MVVLGARSILLTEGAALVLPTHEGGADEPRNSIGVPGFTGFIRNAAPAFTGHTFFNHTALALGYHNCGSVGSLLALAEGFYFGTGPALVDRKIRTVVIHKCTDIAAG